ncbi:MAG: CopG family ribbon-helix-helix protein [Gammaproteobacteria bacterium]
MATTTTLKLPENLKARIARLAKETRRSAHSLMIEALEREVLREERLRTFVKEAQAADAAITGGAEVYRAEEVHLWLDRLARNRKVARPKPWRK